MNNILVEHNPSPVKLEVLGVDDWPQIDEAVSVQEKVYGKTETNYIVNGSAEITVAGQETNTITVERGDLVTLLADTHCTWRILEPMTRQWRTG